MKVAIIGAGISGLSCALELEKHGIKPVIYEKRGTIGDALCHTCLNLKTLNRWISDPLKYLARNYGLSLYPLFRVNTVEIHSPTRSLTAKGNLGYIARRGPVENSLENQLAAKISSPVTFDSFIDINGIKNEFDYIVIATGCNQIAKESGVWTDMFTAQVRYGTVLGDFNTKKADVWFNKKYTKDGFCYLIPESPKAASLVLIVNGITHHELDFYWQQFLSGEHINYKIIETRDAVHNCGFAKPVRLDNMYYVGNTAGFTDDYIGIGAVNAIESGILAARSIAGNLDYNKLVDPIFKHIRTLHDHRKAYNLLTNADLDNIVSLFNLPVVKQVIYANPFFKFSHATFIARAVYKLKKNN